jgi:hypothetical protein
MSPSRVDANAPQADEPRNHAPRIDAARAHANALMVESPSSPPKVSRWRASLPFAALALIACGVYANTLRGTFVYDDQIILHSPLLREPWNLWAFFHNRFRPALAGHVAVYRPLNDWSHVLNYALGEELTGKGESGALFHAVNVLFHAAVVCVAFAWIESLGARRRVAWTAALLFALLPIHTEAVANITGRSESQALFFGLIFLLMHRRRKLTASAAAFGAALLCKESAIAFLPLAVAMDRIVPRQSEARSSTTIGAAIEHGAAHPIARAEIRAYVWLVAVAAAWLALRAYEVRNIDRAPTIVQNPLLFAPLGERLLTAARVQLDYLGLELFPTQLSSDYSMNQIPVITSLLDARVLLFALVLAVSVALAWSMRRRMPLVSFAVLGYAITFSITSNFMFPIGTIMAERLAYAPSLFVCLLLSIALSSAQRWIGARGATALIVLGAAAYAAKTVAQNRVWEDELTLFAEQARTAPNSAKAHAQYANALTDVGRDREAIGEYERSLAIYVYKPEIYYQLGNALGRVRADPERCIDAYRGAIRLMPSHLEARAALAQSLMALGRFVEARAEVAEIAARDPANGALPGLYRRLASAGK